MKHHGASTRFAGSVQAAVQSELHFYSKHLQAQNLLLALMCVLQFTCQGKQRACQVKSNAGRGHK